MKRIIEKISTFINNFVLFWWKTPLYSGNINNAVVKKIVFRPPHKRIKKLLGIRNVAPVKPAIAINENNSDLANGKPKFNKSVWDSLQVCEMIHFQFFQIHLHYFQIGKHCETQTKYGCRSDTVIIGEHLNLVKVTKKHSNNIEEKESKEKILHHNTFRAEDALQEEETLSLVMAQNESLDAAPHEIPNPGNFERFASPCLMVFNPCLVLPFTRINSRAHVHSKQILENKQLNMYIYIYIHTHLHIYLIYIIWI